MASKDQRDANILNTLEIGIFKDNTTNRIFSKTYAGITFITLGLRVIFKGNEASNKLGSL